jgi:hypothetical protein
MADMVTKEKERQARMERGESFKTERFLAQ